MSQQLAVLNNEQSLSEGLYVPHNTDAEQSLLGAILLNNECLEQVSGFLKGYHFAVLIHGKIYDAARSLIERGLLADPITLRAYFEKSDDLSVVGGSAYLIKLADSVVSLSIVLDYGHLIYDLYLRRQLMKIAGEMTRQAVNFNMDFNAEMQIDSAEAQLFELSVASNNDKGFVSFDNALGTAIQVAAAAKASDSGISGITTGLKDIDSQLGGLHNSDLIILAGRPSMGKTALATNIAYNAALAKRNGSKVGANVAFFSLEMSTEQLATRLLAQEAAIPSHKIRQGTIKGEEFQHLVDVSRNLLKIPLYIDDTPALSVSNLRARARRLKKQHGLDLIVIDYLQLLLPPDNMRRNDNRVVEISEITRALKALAKELNIPVIALSQLSRAVEQRDDKRPQLADLRESGSIEQDADVVMFVYREEYYESRREPDPDSDKHALWQQRMGKVYNVAEVILAKQRHGPIGTTKLFFDGQLTKFGDLVQNGEEM